MDDPALQALDTTAPVAIGVRRAGDICDLVGRRTYLHAGPPIELGDVVGPMRGAILGALVFEGEAPDVTAAARILDRGEITLVPCHHAGAVGAMAGIVCPTMPVLVVETESGERAFSPLNEGLGKALRFGSYEEGVLTRLRWLRDVGGPLLNAALEDVGGLDVAELQAEGLRRGDECHNRNIASTAAVLARLAPNIVRLARTPDDAAALFEYMAGNPHFFLSFSIACGKAIADAAHRAGDSGLVTAMCANGRSLGIRVAGLGDRWFLADSIVGEPKLFKGFTIEDACPAIGDSYITEVIGLGAFALAAAPALTSFTGGDPTRSPEHVAEVRKICRAESSRFLVPFEGFRGTPLGIDVRLIAKTGIAPLVNNGLAHRDPGVGQVGAGLARLPLEPFLAANAALCDTERRGASVARA